MRDMQILALCGSLRAGSFSAALLRAAREAAPPDVDLRIFERHGELPLFNPDLEPDPPEPVRALWHAVTGADAILIASPEYAHGIMGSLKNMLDWLVGHAPFAFKPVAVLNPADQSHHADASLKEILRTMSADLILDACLRIPVIGSGVAPGAILSRAEFRSALAATLAAIRTHLGTRSATT